MIVDYKLLPIALLLLWLPRPWLRVGTQFLPQAKSRREDRRANSRNPGDVSLRLKEEIAMPRNWLDLVRATIGSILIEFSCFEVAVDAATETHRKLFLIQCCIYVVAVLIQTVRVEGRLTLSPPIFFVFGLSFGLLGWMPAAFSLVAIWVLNLVLPGPGFFLFAFSGLQAVFGVLLARIPLRDAALAGGLSLLPVLLSLMTKRRLMRLSKKSKPVLRVKT